jgi:hypothetical protein
LQPNPNVNAQAQPATVTVAVHNPSIRIRTHLWVLWARIAIRHEVMAQAARKEAQQPGVDLGPLFEAEMDASLTGICAAAFALEALSRELEELRLLPAATVGAWTKNRPSDAAVTLEVLKVAVDPKGVVNLWRQELPWLFKIRGESVHYEGSFQAPQPHPLGTNTGLAQVTYSIENTTRAVNLLVGILERCRDKPKPGARQWSQATQGIITQLIGSRGQIP